MLRIKIRSWPGRSVKARPSARAAPHFTATILGWPGNSPCYTAAYRSSLEWGDPRGGSLGTVVIGTGAAIYLGVKRTTDVILVSLLLVVELPFMALIAIAI